MKRFYRLLYIFNVCLSFYFLTYTSEKEHKLSAERPNLLIIDTAGKHSYAYRNLILMAKNVGFNPAYRNLYDVLENDSFEGAQGILFFMDTKFFDHLNEDGIAKELLEKVIAFGTQKDKALCLLLPSIPFPQNDDPERQTPNKVITQLHLKKLAPFFADNDGVVENYLSRTLQHDARYIGYRTGTTLVSYKKTLPPLPPLTDAHLRPWSQTKDATKKYIAARTTPTIAPPIRLLDEIGALGILARNEAGNNTYLISKDSLFNFADIGENFFVNPLNPYIREQLLHAVQNTLQDFHSACVTKSLTPDSTSPLPLPKEMTQQYNESLKLFVKKQHIQAIAGNKRYTWIAQQGIRTAWLDPEDYVLKFDPKARDLEKESKEEAEKLRSTKRTENAQFLRQAGFNLLWLELNPETFLLEHGINRAEHDALINRTKTIADTLAPAAHATQNPALFVGTDLTTNFSQRPVKNPVIDVYGTTYSKVPSPIDLEHFWKPEVITTIKKVKKELAPIMPVGGLFLDLEMYHAQDQASEYTDIMDFSSLAWSAYRTSRDVPKLASAHDRVAYLRKHRLFKDYFRVLGASMEKIGLAIKASIRTEFPDALIGAYAQTLPSSWVYRNLFAGLSSSHEPLIMATFNASSHHHQKWLTANNIHLIHNSVVMLSKLKGEKDFDMIRSLRKNNDEVWVNRPSRLMNEYQNGQWWSIEASPMEPTSLSTGLSRIKKQPLSAKSIEDITK